MRIYLISAILLLSNISFGQSSNYISLEAKIKEFILKSQWDELLVSAPELITEEPTKGDGYYYTALAFSKLSEMGKATEYLEMAQKLADESLKKKIQDLKADIANTSKANNLAETLNKSDDNKNAADDFRKLWELNKTKVDYAISAVELYIEKADYPAALAILNDPIVLKDPEANKLIEKLNQTPKMIALNGYNSAMREGEEKFKQQAFQESINKFDEALKFFPKDTKAGSYKRKAQEDLVWQTSRSTNTIESYKSYLNKYPLGTYKSEAEDILQRSYLAIARDKAKVNNFEEAVNYYKIYQTAYPSGPQIAIVNTELCELYFAEAQKVEKVKESYNMKRALELYGLAKQCNINRVSDAHLRKLKRKEVDWAREDMPFLGWHADQKNLIGFMSGSLKNRKVGMYLAARAGSDFFESANADWETNNENSIEASPDKNKKYNERNLNRIFYGTIGITKKIIYPLWIYGGAGVMVNSQLKEFIHNSSGQTEYVKNTDLDYIAINPEIGLQVKLAFLTLRYGINKPLNSLFEDQFVQHFGVGIKF